ncbi:orotate phosphoribosyltransferase [Nitzschia inconspicua]|uniref:Orotidine 5'-phosphate decarboxylase n=1 Tax=Nitzschia inconspicua TaxID=303405 RepID=A0A9K3PFU0_9STRA|nr:orotate phosphoribosyltransferase [Nitzschia inconspicua]
MTSSTSTSTTDTRNTTPFFVKLEARCKDIQSLLCVGLDPHFTELQLPATATLEQQCDAAFSFCKTIIDATQQYSACYKPNAAFFEALGDHGMITLKRVLQEIPPEIPVLLDVKRGDIGTTAAAYAQAAFQHLPNVDAVTLSPLMGWDSIAPFVTEQYSHKGAFLLCKTSNPGSNDLLALNLSTNETLFERIAALSQQWSVQHGASLGLVVGATDASALKKARTAASNAWILAPGVGAQGGDLEAALEAGLNAEGSGMLIPVSRGISQAERPGVAAKELVDAINAVRDKIVAGNNNNNNNNNNNKTYDVDMAATSSTTSSSSSSSSSIQPYQMEFLEFSLEVGVLKFGSFTLKSGRISPYFFNAGLFATGAALFQLGNAYAAAIMASTELVDSNSSSTPKFDVLFGPAYKGIPLGAVVSAALYSQFGINVGYAYNRKEAKDHGEGGTLVGASLTGQRVLVVDDVITAGTAIRESYDLLQGVGATMVGVVIALDRAEKRSLDDPVSAVQAVQRDLGVSVVSIVNLPQLQTFLEQYPHLVSGSDETTLESVKDHRAKYGV